MADMTLAANIGNGTTSFQTLSSRTETDSYGDTTTYVSYEFTATADSGWTFSRWEYRKQTYTWDSQGGYWSPPSWGSWTTFSGPATTTKDFMREAVSYGTIFGDIHNEYSYEVRAVFVQATYSVAVRVSSDSPANSGWVSGGGNGYGYNSSCTVMAFPYSGFSFKKWTTTDSAQATAVSTDATYTFAVTGNVTLYAHFVSATGKLLHGASDTLLYGSSGTLLYDG